VRVLVAGPVDPAIAFGVDGDTSMPLGHGGQGAGVVHDLVQHLVKSGVEVVIVSLSEYAKSAWTLTVGPLTVSLVPMRRSPRRRLTDLYAVEVRRLKEAFRASRPYDVLHAHWTYAYAHAALSVDKEALISLHDSPWRLFRLAPSPGLAALSAQTFWTARRARNVVASSPFVAETWMRDFRGFRPRAIMPNLAPDLAGSERAKQERMRVISMGHPHPNKNLPALIRAWPAIRDAVPQARMTLTGAGTEAGGAFDVAQGASAQGIDMIGRAPRQELLEHLGHSSIMVHPSLSEACPMSIVEAMTLGMPAVVGQQAGPMEWMIGSGGRVVDVSDAGAIADATIQLLTDHAAYDTAQRGAVEASVKFSPGELMPRWLELYSALAQERKRERRWAGGRGRLD
jgi:glycosyltransferase involved in cell wall biosynthesis